MFLALICRRFSSLGALIHARTLTLALAMLSCYCTRYRLSWRTHITEMHSAPPRAMRSPLSSLCYLYSLILYLVPVFERLRVQLTFYRAMHFSAKRGIAIACRLSVRPSVGL